MELKVIKVTTALTLNYIVTNMRTSTQLSTIHHPPQPHWRTFDVVPSLFYFYIYSRLEYLCAFVIIVAFLTEKMFEALNWKTERRRNSMGCRNSSKLERKLEKRHSNGFAFCLFLWTPHIEATAFSFSFDGWRTYSKE